MKKFAHLRPGDKKGRKQANRKIVRAIDEQAALERFRDERTALKGKFHAEHTAFAADFLDEIELGFEFFKASPNFLSARADIFQKFFILDDFQKFQSDGADQRAAAESRAMQARGDTRRDGVLCEYRAERQPSGERLGNHTYVRSGGRCWIREIAAGAAQAALNFVGDQQSAVFRGQSTSAIPEFFADRVNSAFALNGFENYRADRVIELGFEIVNIVELDEFHPRDQWLKRRAIFFRSSNTESAERAPVKRIVHAQDAGRRASVCCGALGRTSAKTRELQRAVDGFRAAIGEKNAVQAGPFCELAGQRPLEFVVK